MPLKQQTNKWKYAIFLGTKIVFCLVVEAQWRQGVKKNLTFQRLGDKSHRVFFTPSLRGNGPWTYSTYLNYLSWYVLYDPEPLRKQIKILDEGKKEIKNVIH